MALQGVSIQLFYFAYNNETQSGQTGDEGNHTLVLAQDDSKATPANSPEEIDATNLPGWYRVQLTADEANARALLLSGVSSTANVRLYPAGQITTIPPIAYRAAIFQDTEELSAERGTTWQIEVDGLTVSATRDKLYVTAKQRTVDTPLADVDDADAVFQIEESDGLIILNGNSQSTPNSDAGITVAGGLDSITITMVASKSAEIGPYERGRGLYLDVRQVEGSTVEQLTRGRLIVTTEVTRRTS